MDYPIRNYLWDAQAIDTPDGGVVVDLTVVRPAAGSCCGNLHIPELGSTAKNGDTTNINALFSYPEVIGSMNIHTPPAIRLLDSHYDLPGYLVCTKHLALEPNVTFTGTIGPLRRLGAVRTGRAASCHRRFRVRAQRMGLLLVVRQRRGLLGLAVLIFWSLTTLTTSRTPRYATP